MSKNDYHRIHFTAKIKFTTNVLINSIKQIFIEYRFFTSAGFRPVNKKKASPARRSQSDKIKEELSKRAKLNAANYIGIWGNGDPRRHFWFYFEAGN